MDRPEDKALIALDEGTDIQRDPDVVEFALVLSRTIDSLEQQPDQMRQALYELARHKLNEQLRGKPGKEFRHAHSTLETAIGKVERFYTEHGAAGGSVRKLSPPPDRTERRPAVASVSAAAPAVARVPSEGPASRYRRPASVALRLAMVLCLLAAGAAALQAFRSSDPEPATRKAEAGIEKPVAADSASKAQQASAQAPAAREPDPLLPSHFGAFAVADGKLFELRLLRGAVPDPRVAISPAIKDDSETILPDGKSKFIIYRRDLPGSMPTRAEVRVIARVKQYQANAAENETTKPQADHWVIRNISFPYRIAPVQGAPDMFEIESEASDFALAPGRYALVWKGIGYDFAVAGAAGPRHCLEQTRAVNGVFYSECR